MKEERNNYGFIYYLSFFFSMILMLFATINLFYNLSSMLGINVLDSMSIFIVSLFISIVCLGISKIIELLTDIKNSNE